MSTSAAEFFITFYKKNKVQNIKNIPNGFIDPVLGANSTYDRVPYAFAWKYLKSGADFTLISVHLNPLPNAQGSTRRKQELSGILSWIEKNSSSEKDYIVLGDMNIQGTKELKQILDLTKFETLNDNCVVTTTASKEGRCYDHVMYKNNGAKRYIDENFGLKVVDMVGNFLNLQTYEHTTFINNYSDHVPVAFRLTNLNKDLD